MRNKKKLYIAEKLKLDDKKIKEHIFSWPYETRDKDGNIIVEHKGKRVYTPCSKQFIKSCLEFSRFINYSSHFTIKTKD